MPERTPVTSAGGLVELDAGPRLDPAEAVRLRRAVALLSADHALVELRVDRVVAFDAAGLGLLLGLHRLARAKGAGLLVVGPDERLLAALRRRGLHRILVIEMLPDQQAGGRAQVGPGAAPGVGREVAREVRPAAGPGPGSPA